MESTASDRPAETGGSGQVEVAFPSLDGKALRARRWTSPVPRGVLLVVHGLGEHSGSYRRTAEALLQVLDLDILALDFRGSGLSAGKRGVIRDYDDLSLDLEAANGWAATARPGLPRFLLGHSNGGLVALRTVLDHDLGLSGLIVSNPSIRLLAPVPAWKRLVGQVLLRLSPSITLPTGLSNKTLTRDPVVVDEIAADPLRHDQISSPLFFGMEAAGPRVLARAAEITLPMLMILGGNDPLVDPLTNRDFFDRLGTADKTLRLYPEMRHEPLNEVGREIVLASMAAWLEPRLVPRS